MKSTVLRAFKDASLDKRFDVNDIYEGDADKIAKLEGFGLVKKIEEVKKVESSKTKKSFKE